MTKHSKAYVDAAKQFDPEHLYSPAESFELVKSRNAHWASCS